MDGIPCLAVSVPLYIALPRHPITRRKRYALVNATLERVGRTHVRMKTQWAIVEPPEPFQGDVEPVVPTAPSVAGVTTFMPQNPLASPVFMFISHLDGRRIRPGLLVTVVVRQNLPAGSNSMSVYATVSVNAGCRTGYSTEVGLGPMLVDGEGVRGRIDVADMDEARQEFLAEMTARAESVGPGGSGTGSDGDVRREPTVENQEGFHSVDGSVGQEGGGVPATLSATVPLEATVQSAVRQVEDEQRIEAVAGTTTGLKDEHCIDDMVAVWAKFESVNGSDQYTNRRRGRCALSCGRALTGVARSYDPCVIAIGDGVDKRCVTDARVVGLGEACPGKREKRKSSRACPDLPAPGIDSDRLGSAWISSALPCVPTAAVNFNARKCDAACPKSRRRLRASQGATGSCRVPAAWSPSPGSKSHFLSFPHLPDTYSVRLSASRSRTLLPPRLWLQAVQKPLDQLPPRPSAADWRPPSRVATCRAESVRMETNHNTRNAPVIAWRHARRTRRRPVVVRPIQGTPPRPSSLPGPSRPPRTWAVASGRREALLVRRAKSGCRLGIWLRLVKMRQACERRGDEASARAWAGLEAGARPNGKSESKNGLVVRWQRFRMGIAGFRWAYSVVV
ncbi:hypothetical protein LXA43DRAFT_1067239 [Ganoderma leucocontextum]|nr:hypothetical protein LXA43DRAFT_1067239 [Ganoderma leucocontextum]